MKNTKLFSLGVVAMAALMTISGCGGGNKSSATGKEDSDHSVVMVTDVSGVDDKSFNQSAWEGLQKWGKSRSSNAGSAGMTIFNPMRSPSSPLTLTRLYRMASRRFSGSDTF